MDGVGLCSPHPPPLEKAEEVNGMSHATGNVQTPSGGVLLRSSPFHIESHQ